MATEDLTIFDKTDASTYLTVSATSCQATSIPVTGISILWDDYGANAFDGDFDIYFDFICTTGENLGAGNAAKVWGPVLDNSGGLTQQDHHDGSVEWIGCEAYSVTHNARQSAYLVEVDGTNWYNGTAFDICTAMSTQRYGRFVRDEAVGTYGTIYWYNYSDSGRLTLVNSASLALHTSKKDYRYFYAFMSADQSNTAVWSGTWANYDLNGAGGGTPAGQPTMRRWGGIPGMDLGGRMNW